MVTRESAQSGGATRACGYALAAILLGQALWLGRERFSAIALALATGAIVIVAAALAIHWPASVETLAKRWLGCLIGFGAAAGILRLPAIGLFIRDPSMRAGLMPFVALAGIAIFLVAMMFIVRSRAMRLAGLWVLVAVHALMGTTVIGSLSPGIDVYIIQQLGCKTLARGENPFAMTFPDPYGPGAAFYPPGVVVDGRVQCGYFYTPLSLLLDMPAWLAAGEVRFAHLAALALTALLIAHLGRREWSASVAAMFLFTPGVFYLLMGAWIEPFLVMLLAATALLARRGQRIAAAVMLGLFFASKQYAPFVAPAALLLLPRPWRRREVIRLALIALLSGLAVTLPFVLWDPAAFLNSMTRLYVGMVRADSISYLPLLARSLGWQPSLLYAAAATIPAIALCLWRAPRTPDGFAASSALTLLCAFVMSTQAFGNYYFLTIGALCTAIAVGGVDDEQRPEAAEGAAPA